MEKQLFAALTQDSSPPVISIEAAAGLLSMCMPTLRQIQYSGKCPFGLGYDGRVRGYGIVLKIPFYYFMMNEIGSRYMHGS